MARDGTKSGGRPKGSLNRKTLDLMAKCEEKGVDAFDVLLDLAKNPDDNIRLKAATEICGYLYAKKRAVEVSGNLNQELALKASEFEQMSKEELIAIIKAELKGIK